MVLETTIICLDNSEFSRNGDYTPSRLEAQRDAANIICGAKTNQNAENAVGLLTAAGDRAIVRVTPTQDVGKILQSLHNIQPEGELDVVRGLQTAQLALKHRMHKNQRQRIIFFIGSPIKTSEKQLELVGRTLKKNNVSLDIISFGDVLHNSEKLNRLFCAVNSNDTSHFLEYPVDSTRLLSDIVMTSPIIRSSNGGAASNEMGDLGVDIGADPNADPELYMALQISLQEEEARQARIAAATTETAQAPQVDEAPITNTVAEQIPESVMDSATLERMDDELRQALSVSLNELQNQSGGTSSAISLDPQQADTQESNPMLSSISHEIARSGDISILPTQDVPTPLGDTDTGKLANKEEIASITEDTLISATSMIQQFLSGLPGIDTTNPALQEAVQQVIGAGAQKESVENQEKEANISSNSNNENLTESTKDQKEKSEKKEKED